MLSATGINNALSAHEIETYSQPNNFVVRLLIRLQPPGTAPVNENRFHYGLRSTTGRHFFRRVVDGHRLTERCSLRPDRTAALIPFK